MRAARPDHRRLIRLGVAFALGFAEAAADVVICARRADRRADTKAAVQALGRRGLAEADDRASVVSAALEAFERVDILINNAGVGTAVPATREAPEDFRRVLDVNVTGSFLMA